MSSGSHRAGNRRSDFRRKRCLSSGARWMVQGLAGIVKVMSYLENANYSDGVAAIQFVQSGWMKRRSRCGGLTTAHEQPVAE
jgi:hypothetical protein